MNRDAVFDQLLFGRQRLQSLHESSDIRENMCKTVKYYFDQADPDTKDEILSILGHIDIDDMDSDDLAELTDIMRDASCTGPSNTYTLTQTDFDSYVDNGTDTALSEKPVGRMLTTNMIRTKHKMGLNSIPKSKLKAMRIKNRLKNLKKRIEAKKYYKQNKAALQRYNKSYQNAIKTGKHKAATRRKS